MRKTLKVVAFGGGPADAFIKAAGITDSTQQTAIKTLVNDLNGYGLWSKMKAIYPMVGGNATAHSYNLKDTTKFQIAFSGGWTHSSTGATPNGTNAYADSFLNAANILNKNNTHVSFYSRTDSNGVFFDIGASNSNSSQLVSIYSRLTGQAMADIGSYSTSRVSVTVPNSLGFLNSNRTASNVFKLFKNGTQIGSNSYNDTTLLPSSNFLISAVYSTIYEQYSNRQCAFATIGEGLSDTEAANLYTSIQKFQTTLNRFVGTPIYSSFDSDAQSFMTSASITDSTQQAAVNYLVTDLKSNNLWTKMKAVYPMVGGTATSHSYNLKNPSQFQITFNGGWTHSSNGILPNGTNGYADTKVNLSITLTNNNYHLSHYSRTQSTTGTQVDMASVGNPPEMIGLTQYYGGISAKSFLCGDYNTNNIAFNDTNTLGLMVGSRTSQTSAKMFMNNVQRGSTLTANNPNALPNRIIFLAANNSAGGIIEYSSRQCAFATIGDGLTDTDASNLYTIIQNYQTILSRQV